MLCPPSAPGSHTGSKGGGEGEGRVLAIALLTRELVTRSVLQIRPLADIVHSKYSFTYLLTYLLTISEVAADWHELMIPRRIMRPSITARASEQLDPRCSTQTYRRPN